MPKRVVDVLVPVALDRAYSYRVPDQLVLAPGDIVSVPLGAREATAVVWADNPTPNPRLDNRLKDVEEKLELPPLRPELRSFVDWVANYTVSSRGMVLLTLSNKSESGRPFQFPLKTSPESGGSTRLSCLPRSVCASPSKASP